MDMGSMDLEEIQETWILARRAWDLARRQQRRRQAAGEPLTDAENSSLRRARADFQAAERLWDEAYRAGIIIAVDERHDAGLTGLYQQVVSAPLDIAPRLAYAEAVPGADPERADSSGCRSRKGGCAGNTAMTRGGESFPCAATS